MRRKTRTILHSPLQSMSILLLVFIVIAFGSLNSTKAQWTTNSNDVYKTNTAGNVGIGTTNPQSKLEIDSGDLVLTHVSGDTGKKGIFAYNTPYSAEHTFSFTRQNTVANSDLSISAYAGIGLTGGKTAPESSAFHFYINPSGNVGIGTTSPGAKLDISGATYSLPATSGTSQTGLVARFKDSRSSGDVVLDVGNAANVNAAWLQSTDMRSLALNYSLLLNPNGGNVGIGTTNPLARLHVKTNTDENLWVRSASGLDLTAAKDDGSNFVKLNVNASPFIINAGSGGNVGIGTASPQGKLHVKAGTDKNIWLRDGGSSQKAQIISVADDNGTINTLSIDGSNLLLNSQSSGTVAIATSTPNTAYKLDVNGDVRVTGNISAKYQDVAEWVPASEQLSPGTVVVLDSTKSNQVTSSSTSYDTRVAGVVSEEPGISLGEKGDNKVLVATTGRVRVRVDASKAAIHIGDLLVTSNIPGVAMRSQPVEFAGRKMHMPGTLIGKALEPLEKGKGEILVLLSLQ